MVKNYSEAEVKVRDATSNDPWGPSSTLMGEISDLTYNIVALGEVMRMIWKRLNDHGKNWRHVYKSLVLLDYLIKNGNEKVAQQCKEHIVAIQTLKDFRYLEEQKDQGLSVREKAKQLVELLRDDERLKAERAKAFKARERYAQNAMGISSDNKMVYSTGNTALRQLSSGSGRMSTSYTDPYGGATRATNGLSPELEAVRPSDPNEEDLQIKLAIMLSQQEHEEDVQRKRADDAKLQIALEQSKSDNEPNGLVDLSDDPWQARSNGLADDLFSPFSSSSNSSKSAADPWGALGSTPSNQNFDPWVTPTTTSIPPPPPVSAKSNPWLPPPNNTSASNSPSLVDPWTAPSSKNEELDLFSMKKTDTSSDPFGDFFGSANPAGNQASRGSTNPWNNTNDLAKASGKYDPFSDTSSKINATRKTPESFLGENSSLVNLENLIPARPKSTNPFGSAIPSSNGMTSSASIGQLNNPFVAAQQSQKPPTINQLQQQSMFQQPAAGTPPLIPQPTFGQPLIATTSAPIGYPPNSTPFAQPTSLFPNLVSNTPAPSASSTSTNPFLMM